MATPVNWTREETFKLINLWSEDVIQQQLEGCRRNSLVYRKIADDLGEAGYTRSLEQCRDKIKKLKGEYKKVHDKRETTREGRYPKWEFFDALDNVLGPKHSTEPPTVVESLQRIGPDDESQHLSGQTTVLVVHSPAPSQTWRLVRHSHQGVGHSQQVMEHSLLGVRHSHLGVGASRRSESGEGVRPQMSCWKK